MVVGWRLVETQMMIQSFWNTELLYFYGTKTKRALLRQRFRKWYKLTTLTIPRRSPFHAIDEMFFPFLSSLSLSLSLLTNLSQLLSLSSLSSFSISHNLSLNSLCPGVIFWCLFASKHCQTSTKVYKEWETESESISFKIGKNPRKKEKEKKKEGNTG